MQAARHLLETGGAPAVTMGAVASQAGVSRGAIYLHFASRTDLLTGLFDHMLVAAGFEESIARVRDSPDGVSSLAEFVQHGARVIPAILPVAKAVEQVRQTDSDAAQHWLLALQLRTDLCRDVVQRLHKDGRLAVGWDLDAAADILNAWTGPEVYDLLVNGLGWAPDQYVQHITTVLRSSLIQLT